MALDDDFDYSTPPSPDFYDGPPTDTEPDPFVVNNVPPSGGKISNIAAIAARFGSKKGDDIVLPGEATQAIETKPSRKAVRQAHEGTSAPNCDKLTVASASVPISGATLPGQMPPPANTNVEAALIGCILVNQSAFALIADHLCADDFYDVRHGKIWEAACRLFQQGVIVDPITVANDTRMRGEAQSIGGIDYLAELTSLSIPLEGLEHYAKIIRDYASLRRMITVATEITSEAYHGGYDVADFLNRSESKLLAAGEQREVKKTLTMHQLLDDFLNQIESRRANDAAIGIPSGYPNLDAITRAFRDSRLCILAGRPGSGKTSLALNFAYNFVRGGHSVLFASLEMSAAQLMERFVSLHMGINGARVQDPKFLSRGELEDLERERVYLESLPLYVDDQARMSVLELRSKIKRIQTTTGKLDAVIVDYLQLMAPADMRTSREQQVAGISAGLLAIAKDFKIPVIALSQLSRETEKRSGGDKRPQLSDLRESGTLEQDSALVMMVYRPEYYKKNPDGKPSLDDPERGLMEVIVAKNRFGGVGTAKMRFIHETTAVMEWDGPAGGAPTVAGDLQSKVRDWTSGSYESGRDGGF
ncbi:MAG: replicative DNA helicase [Smithellaceae bacterium]|jgi:replicative DNA helicase